MLGIVITVMIAYGIFSLTTSFEQIREAVRTGMELKAEIEAASEENKELNGLIADLDSEDAKERLAHERLGLTEVGEIIFAG